MRQRREAIGAGEPSRDGVIANVSLLISAKPIQNVRSEIDIGTPVVLRYREVESGTRSMEDSGRIRIWYSCSSPETFNNLVEVKKEIEAKASYCSR
eukprot:SAG11_NODE_7085_length_1196_cov_3.048314_1_plen_96_part_00